MATNTPLIRIPEFILHESIENGIEYLRDNYSKSTLSDKSDTYLYKLLGNLLFQRYKCFEQAVEIFINNDKETPRYLEIDLMFNNKRDTPPHIHITVPGDQPSSNGIGLDEGYLDSEYFTNIKDQVISEQPTFTRRYRGTYDFVITTDNSTESILICHIVRAILTSLIPHLNLSGLENISIASNDLVLYQELVPKNFFSRVVRLTCEYESSTLRIEKQLIPKTLDFKGEIKEK